MLYARGCHLVLKSLLACWRACSPLVRIVYVCCLTRTVENLTFLPYPRGCPRVLKSLLACWEGALAHYLATQPRGACAQRAPLLICGSVAPTATHIRQSLATWSWVFWFGRVHTKYSRLPLLVSDQRGLLADLTGASAANAKTSGLVAHRLPSSASCLRWGRQVTPEINIARLLKASLLG